MAWQGWNPKLSALNTTLQNVQGGLSEIVVLMDDTLNAVKAAAEVAKVLLVELPDADVALLEAAIKIIRETMDGLVSNAGCYYLPIPTRVIDTIPDELVIYMPDPGGAETVSEVMLPNVSLGKSGGNYGLMLDVSSSLNDQDDLMRPQFDADAHIGALVVVAGVSTYLQIIPLISKLVKLFSGTDGSAAGEGLAETTLPKVTELQYEYAPSVIGQAALLRNRLEGGESEHPYAVKLSWDLHDKVTTVTDYGEPFWVTIDKIVVYRAEVALSLGMSDAELEQYRIKDFEYDGTTNFFFDDTIELDKHYYYAVGYDLIGEYGVTVDLGVVNIAVLKVDVPATLNLFPRTGTPPDWTLLPNPLALIPGIGDIVDTVNLFLDGLEKRLENKSSKVEKYIDALVADAERYGRIAEQVVSTVDRIVELMTLPDTYIGVNTFSGKGGNTFFLNALGNALNDTSDPERPPFDRGDEVLTGFILLAGSATAGKITNFVDLLGLLTNQAPTNVSLAYRDAMASIGYLTDTVERQIDLLSNLSLDTTGPGITPKVPQNAIGVDLEPATEQNDGTECKET